jgi:hypothetical protein
MQLRSRPLDVAEPPGIVFESEATCGDGRHAEAQVREALARARAPAPAWLVTVRIHKTAPNALQASGDITDERAAAVGHREFTGKASDCDAMARAVGVWASLVLDAEIRRPRTAGATSEDAERSAKSDAGVAQDSKPVPKASDPQPDPMWQPPDEAPSRRDETAALELGIGGFMMTGIGGGSALLGATPFLLIPTGNGFYLRPSVAVGESLAVWGPPTWWAAVRLDGCYRVVGQYASRRGLHMDMCGGADVGALDVKWQLPQPETTVPYVAPGPSLDIGGELGDLAVILRAVAGVNVVHQIPDTPVFSGRGELDFSWALQ